MRPKHPLIWAVGLLVLFFVAITFFNGIKAGAVPIHKHIYAHKELAQGREVRVLTAVKKYDVAPPYVPPVSPSPSAGPIATSSGGCPASLAGESTSPTAVNPSSGAAGCIQALPSTWAAYGDPAYASAADAPVSVQMQAMAKICAAQGNGAWVAANPCG